MSKALNSDRTTMENVLHCVVSKRAVKINDATYSTAQSTSSLVPMLFDMQQLMPGIELVIDTINGSVSIDCPNEIILEALKSRVVYRPPFRRPSGMLSAARRKDRSRTRESNCVSVA